MRKVIKLTESDLMNIVKRVIKEQSSSLETKLRDKGYINAKSTGGKKVLVKKIPNQGDFFFELKNNGADINVLNPSNKSIFKLDLKKKGKNKLGDWYTKGFQTDVEAERLSDYIVKVIDTTSKPKPIAEPENPVVDTPFPMDEERFDFGSMSDEELHSLHPHVKKHKKHFKDFSPTSEYLGWRGEVNKRNIYKKGGKFHDAFDNNKED